MGSIFEGRGKVFCFYICQFWSPKGKSLHLLLNLNTETGGSSQRCTSVIYKTAWLNISEDNNSHSERCEHLTR